MPIAHLLVGLASENIPCPMFIHCISCYFQWLSQTIMVRLVQQIGSIDQELARIGCEDMQIGGEFMIFFINHVHSWLASLI